MYTQAMDTMGKDCDDAPRAARSAEEAVLQARFDERIDAGDFIEAKDWMPENYRKTLVRQISRTVRWEQSMRKIIDDGVTLFVELGAGKVLAGMIKRIDKSVPCVSVESPADLQAARDAIRAQR